MICLLISQSHKDLEAMNLMQLRKMCEEKGVKPTSWARDKLLKLITGGIVMNATIPHYLHSRFNMHSDIASSFNTCIVLGAASSRELPPPDKGSKVGRTLSLSFANKGEKPRDHKNQATCFRGLFHILFMIFSLNNKTGITITCKSPRHREKCPWGVFIWRYAFPRKSDETKGDYAYLQVWMIYAQNRLVVLSK